MLFRSHLEVDEWTVVYVDLPALDDKVDLSKLKKPVEFYDAFTRCYGPILANNLTARLDGKELEFRCAASSHRVADHLQCDFRFEAACAIDPEKQHTLTFREGNYELESGMLRLTMANSPGTPLVSKSEPDEALKSRPASCSGSVKPCSRANAGLFINSRKFESCSNARK